MPAIPAGDLTQRITLQTATEGIADDYGAKALTWGNVTVLWAQVRPLSGREIFQAAQAGAEVSHEVRFRWRSGITPKDRFKLGTRTLNIVSLLNEDEANAIGHALCIEEI